MNAVFTVWAALAWGMTVVLVSQLLGGTFDTRLCHSDCVLGLYTAAFAVTVTGCLAGGWYLLKGRAGSWLAKAGVGALWVLLVVFLTTMAIGTFG